jgi:hypothetical protein
LKVRPCYRIGQFAPPGNIQPRIKNKAASRQTEEVAVIKALLEMS